MFLPRNHQQQLRGKLDQLKQAGNLPLYINDFMNIMNQVIDMSEEDRIHYFIRGLSRKTKAEIGYSCPKSLHHAIELAQNFDSNFFGNRNANAYNQYEQRHDAMEINQVGSERTRSGSKPTGSKWNSTPKTNGSKFCKYCKKSGHTFEECRKRMKHENVKINQSSSYPHGSDFIHINAIINNVEATCMIDTGANQSIISEKTAMRSQLEILPGDSNIVLADGTKMKSLGNTMNTIIRYKHISSNLSFIVMKNPNSEVLLGMDFLQGIKAKIDITNRELILPPSCCNVISDLTTHDDKDATQHQVDEPQTEDDIYLDELWSSKEKLEELVVKTSDHLTNEHQVQLVDFIQSHKDNFASSLKRLGTCKVKRYHINTTTETPIFIHPYENRSMNDNR